MKCQERFKIIKRVKHTMFSSIGTNSGISCDIICRNRQLVCEDCNPEEPDKPQPEPPDPDKPDDPYCGDGTLGNTTGEECEYGDPSGVSCSWYVCDSTCKCPEEPSYCGDGKVVEGEECEVGDPSGTSCTWDSCNQVNCKCVEPGCGDGKIDEGELCERGDPDGFQCLWDTECNQVTCECDVAPSPYCGDGELNEDEQCEEGNPSGSLCDWDKCSKLTCSCPPSEPGGAPGTGIFDTTQSKLILGFGLLLMGIVIYMFGGNMLYYLSGMKERLVFIRDGKRIDRRVKWESNILRKFKK
jgi:hypothetical protein